MITIVKAATVITDPNGYIWDIRFKALEENNEIKKAYITSYTCVNFDSNVTDPTKEVLSHLVDFNTLTWF